MRARTRKRLGFLLFILMVVGVLSIALWQYHQMIVGVYDGATASVYRRMLSPFRDAPGEGLGHRPIRVALLRSDVTAAAMGAEAHGLDGLAQAWERFLTGERIPHRRIARLTDDGVLDDFNVLVMPAASALRDSEFEAIRRFLRRGNGVVMTWATGTRDEENRWRRFSLLQQVAGLELKGAVPGDPDATASVLIDSRSPLAVGISPGFVLSLHRYDQPQFAAVREDRTRVTGAWSADARLEPHRLATPPFQGDRAVIANGEYLGGRFVWLGFTLSSIVETTEQRDAAHHLLRNALAWSSRQAMAYRPAWPEDVRSAFSLSWRIRHASDVDERLLALVSNYRMPLSSFLAEDVISEHPELVRRLATLGEVGLLHEVDSTREDAPAPPPERLRRLHRALAEAAQNGPVGYSMHEQKLSSAWLEAILRAGFRYVSGTRYDHLMPTVVRTYRPVPVFTRSRELWMLPETAYTRAGGGMASNPRGNSGGMLDLFHIVHSLGGYYNLSLAAEQVDTPLLQQLDEVLAAVKRERVWTASMREITEYYRVWGHVKVSTDYPTPNRTAIQISNTGVEPVRNLRVYVQLSDAKRQMDLQPTTLGTPPVQPVTGDGRLWHFDIPRLPPGKNFMYHLYRE